MTYCELSQGEDGGEARKPGPSLGEGPMVVIVRLCYTSNMVFKNANLQVPFPEILPQEIGGGTQEHMFLNKCLAG